MKRLRGKSSVLITLGSVVVLIGIPGWVTWRQVQQERLNNALLTAIKQNNVRSVLSLLEQGADPNAREQPANHRSLWQLLMERWYGKSPVPNAAPPALLVAISQRTNVNCFLPETTQIVKALLAKGADVNARTPSGETVLVMLFEIRLMPGTRTIGMIPPENPALVELLLNHGADTEARNVNRQTALILAAGNGFGRSVRLLLDKGANPNAVAKGCSPGTALAEATLMEHEAIVRLLLARGANMNLRDSTGATAMYFATQYQRTDIIKLLKQEGK